MASKFIGWIPNVAGRLSFSHIGQTRHPYPCRTLNEDDGQARVVICAQQRMLSDTLLWPPYFQFVYGYDPTWFFAFVAASVKKGSDKRAELKGTVYVFSSTRWNTADGADVAGRTLIENAILDGGNAFEDLGASAEFSSAGLRELHAGLSRRAIYSVECTIDRGGAARLESPSASQKVLFSKSVTKKAEKISDQSRRYLVNQVYFFLKDISHSHRHHHKKADTITSAHVEDSDVTWIRETQYSIHRRVVEKRRSSIPSVLYEALGLMAYMKSFKHIVSETIEDGKPAKEIVESYNLEETEDSIKASLEARRWSRVQWNLILTAIPTLALALTALLRSDGETTLFDSFRSFLTSLFPNSLRGFLTMLFVGSLIPIVYGVWNPMNLFYSIKRITIVWPLDRRIITFSIVAFAIFIIAAKATIEFLTFRTDASTFWITAIIATGFVWIAIWFLPYLFTLPDLIRLFRTYPYRPILYREEGTPHADEADNKTDASS